MKKIISGIAYAYAFFLLMGGLAAIEQSLEADNYFSHIKSDLQKKLIERRPKRLLSDGQCAFIDHSKKTTVSYVDYKAGSESAATFKLAASLTLIRPETYVLGTIPGIGTAPCDVLAADKKIAVGDFKDAVEGMTAELMRGPRIAEVGKIVGPNAGTVSLSYR